jgi:hypothetical protein
METTLSAPRIPLSERINLRLLAFVVAFGLLLGMPIYWYVDEAISGGIKHRADGYAEVNLQAMSSFPFDQNNGTVADVPERWRQLDGQKVILEGEMWSPLSAGGRLAQFELVYSIAKCCFSGPPQIQHFVQSTVPEGRQIGYYPNKVRVKGTLRVDITRDQGRITGVYHLDVESVEPV